MTGPDVPDRDMPNFTRPSRQDAPLISDASLAALLAGVELPPDAAPLLRPLARTLAGLAGRPTEDELYGETDTLTAFRDYFGAPGPAHRRRWNRRQLLRSRSLPLRAVAAATAILGLGGLATAAYAGALPAGLQRIAHDIIGAPAAGAQPASRPSPHIPAATGQPAYGMCTAWAQAKAHGTRDQRAAAFNALAAAAGGPGNVTAFCTATARTAPPSSRSAPTRSHSGKPTALPTPHASGEPTGLPTPQGSSKPTGLPTPQGSSKPTGLPTPHRTGKPSALPTPAPGDRSG
jgi:hypothetical protein